MEGKRFIPTIQAVKTIKGVVEAGAIYKLNDMKKLFPYIDFNNTDYFIRLYTNDKFKKGDRVRYTGKTIKSINAIKNDKVYAVVDVLHKVIGELLYTSYTLTEVNSDPIQTVVHTVKEDEIEFANSKWIVSFTNDIKQDRPAVHEFDYFAWLKIKDTWKNIFVFDTREEAIRISNMFADNSIEEIYKKINEKYPGPANAW